ncbi:MAG: two-component regulator propeller domain-containing protein [Niastella sp.]|uniref:ligand-binding sensor domain-containing protein n=1 Tax=Niastella sp. TaxID=1869183 RepID=UPI00389AABF7
MPFFKYLCISFLATTMSGLLHASPHYFRHLEVENGLSNNSITCSLQDRLGFMWFGTKDGLNRYDGYSFKVFKKIEGNKKAIGSNFIHCLYEDKKGILWVGTEGGLFRYSSVTEEFSFVAATSNMFIDKIDEDVRGNIWLLSYYKLCRYDRSTEKIKQYDQEAYFTATTFCNSPDGSFWVATSRGLLEKYDFATDSFSGFNLFSHSAPSNRLWVECLYITSDGHFITGTSDNKIKVFDPVHYTYTDIALSGDEHANLFIKNFVETAKEEWWFGTSSGLFIYDRKNQSVQQIKKDYNNPYSINDNSITSMCRDNEGGIWIGTYYGGINYFANQIVFTKYFPQRGQNSLNGNVVGDIRQDSYGNLWIGTEDEGLNMFNPATGRFTHFEADGKKGSISYFEIHGLLITGDELWIGTYEHGIDIMDIRTRKVTRRFKAWRDGFTHNYIYNIYQDKAGEIYICTASGAYIFNKGKNNFSALDGIPPYWCTSIIADRKNRLWVTTFGYGIYLRSKYAGKTDRLCYDEKDPTSLISNRVTSIYEASNGTIWVATESGLCKWNEKEGNFTRFGMANGFPSDFILSILEDAKKNLWLSTTKGLVRFHPSTGKVEVFTTSNGLISDQFNYHSAFKTPDGSMYFGSTKGLVSFHPSHFEQSTFMPPIYLTNFQVNGQEISPDGPDSLLKQSILYTKQITLRHNQSIFNIDFAAPNYSAPKMVEYAYQMQGLTNNWIYLKDSRRASFTELAPGSYVFRVKAFTSNRWSKETNLLITILPPWWQSRMAYSLYAVFFVLLIFVLVRYYHRRVNEKNKRKFELLRIEKEKEMLEMELTNEKILLQAKIDFFTNVAHEIKTPLTLIKVPLKKVIRKLGFNAEIGNSLQIMERNTDRLIELSGQLLDFRQTELKNVQLYFERKEINQLIAEACSGFTTLAEQNNISFQMEIPQEPLFACIDVDAFNKIIYNLFSNAVKYAHTSVCISLLPYFNSDNSFTLKVKNDGNIIPYELKENIFKPFFRIRHTENPTGTGIGLALALSLASLHGGSLVLDTPEDNMNVFTFTMPVNDSLCEDNSVKNIPAGD